MNFRKMDFTEIDIAFENILNNRDITQSLNRIGDHLSKMIGKRFVVTVSKANNTDPFYLMSVYPQQSTLDSIISSILNEEPDIKLKEIWDNNNVWTVEIDERLLSGTLFPITSRELTALLLHECGHVVESNSIPQRMSKVIKYKYVMSGLGTKNVFKHGLFREVLKLPILKACSIKNYLDHDGLRKEMKADLFAIRNGYGKELQDVLNKIIVAKPRNFTHKDDSMDRDMDDSVDFIKSIEKRETEAGKQNFKNMIINMPGTYMKKVSQGIYDTMFAPSGLRTESVKTQALEESAYYFYENAYVKEAFDIFKKKMKRIDPSIPDYIAIRKEDIKSNDDKLMLVSYIYSKIDLINYYLDIMENPQTASKYIFYNSKNELIRIREALEKDRIDILNYKIPEVRYSIQVQYPTGYEG